MALIVVTGKPQALLNKIYRAIREQTVTTWERDSDGDFTHTSDQWRQKLWLHPTVVAGTELRLTTIPPREGSISTSAYGFYHGHFARMLLTHFDDDFKSVRATARASFGDKIDGS